MSTDRSPIGNASHEEAVHFLKMLGEDPTSTSGILEQRAVDVCSRLLHPSEDWQSRGLGDSVNASNVSRRKLGDCDYQDLSSRTIVAYEAHGGTLSDVYVQEHLRTFKRVLRLRRQEWDNEDWSIRIVFVAYNSLANLPAPFEMEGASLYIEWVSFREFCGRAAGNEQLMEFFDELVTRPLDLPRTPMEVRDKYLSLANNG